MKLKSKTISLLLTIAASIFIVIVGCGGGGGDGFAVPPPSTQPPVTPPALPPTVPPGITVRIANIDTVDCPNVTASVSVNDDPSAAPIKGLTEQNFQVTDATATVLPLTGFVEDPEFQPIIFSMAMDYSKSLTDADIAQMEIAAADFVEEAFLLAEPDPWGEIIKFAKTIQIMTPGKFENDKDVIINAINAVFPPRVAGEAQTALYDAIGTTLEQLRDLKASPGDPGDYPLLSIVITDGEETGASVNYDVDTLINFANDYNIKIVTIGFGNDTDAANLIRLALETGGIYIPAFDAADLANSLSKLLENLNNYYRLTFVNPGPGQQVITVEVTTPSGLTGSDALDYQCP